MLSDDLDRDLYNINYGLRRLEQWESECRGAATYLCNPTSPHVISPCKDARCARKQLCMGPMRPCPYSTDCVYFLGDNGFETLKIRRAPACVANTRDLELRRRFQALRKRFELALWQDPEWKWPAVRRAMKALRWNRVETRAARMSQAAAPPKQH